VNIALKNAGEVIKETIRGLNWEIWLAILVLMIAQWPIWAYLSQPPIFIFDEAIYALNALDMYLSGDPIVLTRGGELTYFNTKPPLVIWLQAMSIGMFGANEFAIRFPSAIAASVTCITILVFSKYTLQDIRIGIVSILILVTSYGYIRPHVTRTGDLDSVLVCFITIYVCSVLHFILAKAKNETRAIWIAGIAATAAFYAKSVAAFFPLPGLLLSALVAKRASRLFKIRATYQAAFMLVFACGMYYVVREFMSPGYLRVVLYSEYSRYVNNIMPWNAHPVSFYVSNLVDAGFFTPYAYALPLCIAIGIMSKKYRLATIVITLLIISYLGVISYPIVKLEWYDAALYPFYSLLCGLGLISILGLIEKRMPRFRFGFPVILLLIFYFPFVAIADKNKSRTGINNAYEREGYTIRKLRDEQPELNSYNLLLTHRQNAHYTQVEFYINSYHDYQGYDIKLMKSYRFASIGDTILCCRPETIDSLEEKFVLQTIYANDVHCRLLVVDSTRAASVPD